MGILKNKFQIILYLLLFTAISVLTLLAVFGNDPFNTHMLSRFFLKRHAEVIVPQGVDTVENFDSNKQSEQWENYTKAVGPVKAYEDLKKIYRDKNSQVAHQAIHSIGTVFYKLYGLKGISYCDQSFSFGCYHSVMAQALSTSGIGNLADLDSQCNKANNRSDIFSCQHGIGHGLTSFIGYQENDLSRILSLCDSLSHKEPVSGCKSGALMEYNFRSMGAMHGMTEIRKLNGGNVYEPCNNLSVDFRASCYFAQATWWDRVLNHDYKLMGSLCSKIEDEESRSWCFKGIGTISVEYSNYDISKIQKVCALMPTKDLESQCIISSSWALFAEPTSRDKAKSVCGLLDDKDKSLCAG